MDLAVLHPNEVGYKDSFEYDDAQWLKLGSQLTLGAASSTSSSSIAVTAATKIPTATSVGTSSDSIKLSAQTYIGTPGVIAQNLVPDPSLEYDTVGTLPSTWNIVSSFGLSSGISASVSNAWAEVGSKSLLCSVTSLGAGDYVLAQAGMTAVTPGQPFALAAWVKDGVTIPAGIYYDMFAAFYDSSFTYITSIGLSSGVTPNGSSQQITLTGNNFVPAGAAYVRLEVGLFNYSGPGGANVSWYVDAAQYTVGNKVGSYSDGDSQGWLWTGTKGNSSSGPVATLSTAGTSSDSVLVTAQTYITMTTLPKLLTHTGAGSTDGYTVTTSGIDTTGASLLIVAATSSYAQKISDSNGNTWTATNRIGGDGQGGNIQIFYCANPTVGTGHTFTSEYVNYPSGSQTYPALAVAAFANTKQSGTADINVGVYVNASSGGPGTGTPTYSGELIVTAAGTSAVAAVDSGFSITDAVSLAGGLHYGVALAYLVENAAAPKSPTWSTGIYGTTMVSFQPGVAHGATSSTGLGLTAPTKIPLAASNGTSTAVGGVVGLIVIPFQQSNGTSTDSIKLTAPTIITLAASNPTSTDKITISGGGVQTYLILQGSNSSSTSLLYTSVTTQVPCDPALAISDGETAVGAPIQLSMQASGGTSADVIIFSGGTAIFTLPARSTSSSSGRLSAVFNTVVISSSWISVDLKAVTTVPHMTSAAVSTDALTRLGPFRVPLGASAATSKDFGVVTRGAPIVWPAAAFSVSKTPLVGIGYLVTGTVSRYKLAPGYSLSTMVGATRSFGPYGQTFDIYGQLLESQQGGANPPHINVSAGSWLDYSLLTSEILVKY